MCCCLPAVWIPAQSCFQMLVQLKSFHYFYCSVKPSNASSAVPCLHIEATRTPAAIPLKAEMGGKRPARGATTFACHRRLIFHFLLDPNPSSHNRQIPTRTGKVGSQQGPTRLWFPYSISTELGCSAASVVGLPKTHSVGKVFPNWIGRWDCTRWLRSEQERKRRPFKDGQSFRLFYRPAKVSDLCVYRNEQLFTGYFLDGQRAICVDGLFMDASETRFFETVGSERWRSGVLNGSCIKLQQEWKEFYCTLH